MRYKVKALVGFYQVIAAVPSVYNVRPPLGLEHLTPWVHLLELPSEFERIFVVPTACLGTYRTLILIGSTWPLVVILACAVCRKSYGIAATRTAAALYPVFVLPHGRAAAGAAADTWAHLPGAAEHIEEDLQDVSLREV